jgi:molybdopterin synthase sulfur carrier subunit
MATLHFTQNLIRHTECPSASYPATAIGELLGQYFAQWPDVRGYVLDDQGEVRKHVKILIDGRNVKDRKTLRDPVGEDTEVHIFQALSGG